MTVKDTTWAADLGEMESLSSKNKNVKYFFFLYIYNIQFTQKNKITITR